MIQVGDIVRGPGSDVRFRVVKVGDDSIGCQPLTADGRGFQYAVYLPPSLVVKEPK